ncbi:GNAT family N-acetyltransferase [Paracidobacterium acidisoli]|uniref:GNAT family N-acetyltransferase n=1 Tax=Paracidobacterium acidisoli TaxID=2303751 RepID=A0A372IJL0_9BACT|nr:GNAT family N-acetyltransferase [Paracidobacterium acidisoli]MBT9333158.1 GNAT family N-acetyltransferase [Paracidobacterium acidisoli]
MTPALQLEIFDLRHFSAGSLRPLLDAESCVWSERLHWDYRASADLLLQYLDSRVLPGFVAVENGRISGYIFCVYEDNKAVIGDVFALDAPRSGATAAEIEQQLLRHLLEMLQNTPGIDRIESQLLLHPHGLHAEIFHHAGFEVHRRMFMELSLERIEPQTASRLLLAGMTMRPWKDEDFVPTGHLISQAYQGHLDSHINDQYRSTAGSLRFLHNIVRFPGCGMFDPEGSRILLKAGQQEPAGVLLCSRVRGDVGHVTQVCVAKSYRGLGLGEIMLRDCAANLKKRGFHTLTLTVTASNTNAAALYERLGFVETHTFDAMVWDHRQTRPGGL